MGALILAFVRTGCRVRETEFHLSVERGSGWRGFLMPWTPSLRDVVSGL